MSSCPSSLRTFILFNAIAVLGATVSLSQERAEVVYREGRQLIYVSDREGNRMPDFSYAGYRQGEVPLPAREDIQCAVSVRPGQDIQRAIDSIPEARAGSFSGAVCLSSGVFEVDRPILLNRSGVVLRGAGDDPLSANGATVIQSTWRSNTPAEVIVVGGGDWGDWKSFRQGSGTTVTSERVTVGSRTVEMQNVRGFSEGDLVLLVQPCSAEWLEAVGFGGSDRPWQTCGDLPSDPDVQYVRRISGIEGNHIILDAPIYSHLDRALSVPRLFRLKQDDVRRQVKSNIGVEDLVVEMSHDRSVVDEALKSDQWPFAAIDHPSIALIFKQAQDSWVRNATFKHFSFAGVASRVARRITVENVRSVEPVGPYDGGYRYNNSVGGWTQLVLFKDTKSTYARHGHVVNGSVATSGIVFLRSTGYQSTQAAAESHQPWSQGILFDNHREVNPQNWHQNPLVRLGDNSPGGHGWTAVHSAIWNSSVGGGSENRWLLLQKPPLGQNYAIGFSGEEITGLNRRFSYSWPLGHVELQNRRAEPESLYEAQLTARGYALPAAVYLSNLEPALRSGGAAGDLLLNESVRGRSVRLNGMEYVYSVGMRSGTDVRYQLGSGYTRFTADIGLDDQAANSGAVVFRVYADGDLVAESEALRPISPTAFVDVDVRNVEELTLSVETSGDGLSAPYGYWTNARLLP